MIEFLINHFPVPGPLGFLEILFLAVIFYYGILFFRGTRGAAVLSGLIFVLVLIIFLTNLFNLAALTWLLQRFYVYLAVAFLIIFQPEIRRALSELGKQRTFGNSGGERSQVEHIVQAAVMLAERKIGALVAVEREIGTRSIQETGTRVGSPLTSELLATIFFPNTPLHDGGVIVSRNRIMSAGCLFPLSQRQELSKTLGMRHRAALGMSEESDAIVIVVSEETGGISVAYKGNLSHGYDEDRLRRLLSKVLLRDRKAKSTIKRVKEQLDLTPEGMAKTEEMSSEKGPSHAG